MQMSIDDPDMQRPVCFWNSGGFEPTTSQEQARSIMAPNFFGVEEAIRHFKVNPSPEQLATLAEVPYGEAVLQSVKGTHTLVAVFPMSVLDIRGKVAGNSQPLFYNQDWYNKEKFANKERGRVGWHLVRKTPVPDSINKTWSEQQALLTETEETPTTQVMVYTITGHFLATGERLFKDVYVRCSDLDSYGYRVLAGVFDAGGLGLGYWVGFRDVSIGLSASLKFQAEN